MQTPSYFVWDRCGEGCLDGRTSKLLHVSYFRFIVPTSSEATAAVKDLSATSCSPSCAQLHVKSIAHVCLPLLPTAENASFIFLSFATLELVVAVCCQCRQQSKSCHHAALASGTAVGSRSIDPLWSHSSGPRRSAAL